MTTTGSLSRTGAGNPHHWLARDPTGSLNRTGTGQKFCTAEIRVSMVIATSITSSGSLILCNWFPVPQMSLSSYSVPVPAPVPR